MNTLRLPGAQLGSRASTQTASFKPASSRRPAMLVRCSASQKTEDDERSSLFQKAALPAAALLGAALLFAATPDEALAARSGGRVGGSGFSSRARSAPMPSRGPSGGGGGVRNYNYYSAPPLISPYGGYGGYGMFGGGLGFFPMAGMGSFFNIILIMFVLNVVLQTVRGFTNGSNSGKKKEDDEDERW